MDTFRREFAPIGGLDVVQWGLREVQPLIAFRVPFQRNFSLTIGQDFSIVVRLMMCIPFCTSANRPPSRCFKLMPRWICERKPDAGRRRFAAPVDSNNFSKRRYLWQGRKKPGNRRTTVQGAAWRRKTGQRRDTHPKTGNIAARDVRREPVVPAYPKVLPHSSRARARR